MNRGVSNVAVKRFAQLSNKMYNITPFKKKKTRTLTSANSKTEEDMQIPGKEPKISLVC